MNHFEYEKCLDLWKKSVSNQKLRPLESQNVLNSTLVTAYPATFYCTGEKRWMGESEGTSSLFFLLQKGCVYVCQNPQDSKELIVPFHSVTQISVEYIHMVLPTGLAIRTLSDPEGLWFGVAHSHRNSLVCILEYFWRIFKLDPTPTPHFAPVFPAPSSSLRWASSAPSNASPAHSTLQLLSQTCEVASASLSQLKEQGDQLERIKNESLLMKHQLKEADKILKTMDSWSFPLWRTTGSNAAKADSKWIPANQDEPKSAQSASSAKIIRLFPVIVFEAFVWKPKLMGISLESIHFIDDQTSQFCNSHHDLEIPLPQIANTCAGDTPFSLLIVYSQPASFYDSIFRKSLVLSEDRAHPIVHISLPIMSLFQTQISSMLESVLRKLSVRLAQNPAPFPAKNPPSASSTQCPDRPTLGFSRKAPMMMMDPQQDQQIDAGGMNLVEQQDAYLDQMLQFIHPLKQMAVNMNQELDIQNQVLHQVDSMIEDVSHGLKETNKKVSKHLQ